MENFCVCFSSSAFAKSDKSNKNLLNSFECNVFTLKFDFSEAAGGERGGECQKRGGDFVRFHSDGDK